MKMSLTKEIKSYKVSSVLNGDKKMYGKTFLFDGSDETCWNSDKGPSQRIDFSFNESKTVTQLKIQFQGGFSAKQIQLEGKKTNNDDNEDGHGPCDEDKKMRCEFHPRDTNQFQEFTLPKPMSGSSFSLVLSSSYDFYGRIIIYHLDIIGE